MVDKLSLYLPIHWSRFFFSTRQVQLSYMDGLACLLTQAVDLEARKTSTSSLLGYFPRLEKNIGCKNLPLSARNPIHIETYKDSFVNDVRGYFGE